MSLKDAHKVGFADHTVYRPEFVMLIKLIHDNKIYYLLEFGGQSQGIVCKANGHNNFTDENGNFLKILAEIITFNGIIPLDYAKNYQGKLATFKHPASNNSNWVGNALKAINK